MEGMRCNHLGSTEKCRNIHLTVKTDWILHVADMSCQSELCTSCLCDMHGNWQMKPEKRVFLVFKRGAVWDCALGGGQDTRSMFQIFLPDCQNNTKIPSLFKKCLRKAG